MMVLGFMFDDYIHISTLVQLSMSTRLCITLIFINLNSSRSLYQRRSVLMIFVRIRVF